MAEFRFYGEGIYELAQPMQLLDERAIYTEWFRSLDTCIMLVSQALWLSLQIWRFGFLILICKTDSHSDANDLRSVAPSAFKIQSQFALPFSKETLILGRKHPKLAAGPGVLIRRWQIAFTDVVDVGATVTSLKSLRSRHVTKSNGVVGPVILLLTRYQFCRR